jgi:hypothetical protein
MLQVLVAISQKFCCRKETGGYAKVSEKRERKRKIDTKVSEILKTMNT